MLEYERVCLSEFDIDLVLLKCGFKHCASLLQYCSYIN